MKRIVIRAVENAADVDVVGGLMREYGEYLAHLSEGPAGAARICLSGYEAELAGLPEPYVAPGGLMLAEVDGASAGCVALKALKPRAGVEAGALELKRLWVRPGFRGLGLGRGLMESAVHHARNVRARAIYLDTVPAAMAEANRLYGAMGFVRVQRYNDNEVQDIAFFRLDFAQADRAADGLG